MVGVTNAANAASAYGKYSAFSASRTNGIQSYAYTAPKPMTYNPSSNSSISSLMNFNFSNAFDKNSNLFMSEMKDNLNSLKDAASTFGKTGTNSMFNQSLVSSNSAVATGGKAGSMSQLNGKFNLKVDQIASSQVSSSTSFYKNSLSTIGSGSFSIEMDGKKTNISYSAVAGDTNEKALSRIASSINNSKAGVTASVVTSKDNKMSLQIVSKETGTNSSFSITDNSGSNTISSLNMATTAEAQNAQYSVNGESFTSQSNTVQLGATTDAPTATLRGKGEASFSRGTDGSTVYKEVTDMLNSYNSVINTLGSKSNPGTGVSRVESLMSSGIGSSRNLSQMGITKNYDGTLSINKDKFMKAVSDDPSRVQDTLSSVSKSLSRNADIASRIPQSTFTSMQKMSYSSMNNALLTSGLLFNLGI